MSSEEVFTDIMNAAMRLRHAFMKHDLKPPFSIELGSHRDGAELLRSLPESLIVANPKLGRDPSRPDICFEMYGTEFRFPSEIRAIEGGGFRYE